MNSKHVWSMSERSLTSRSLMPLSASIASSSKRFVHVCGTNFKHKFWQFWIELLVCYTNLILLNKPYFGLLCLLIKSLESCHTCCSTHHHHHHHVRLMEVVKRNHTKQLTNLLKVRKTYFKYGTCSVIQLIRPSVKLSMNVCIASGWGNQRHLRISFC